MSIKYPIMFAMIYLVLTLLGRMSEGLGYQTEDAQAMSATTSIQEVDYSDYPTGAMGWVEYQWDRASSYVGNVGTITTPIQGFWQFATFDYPLYTGGWAIVRWLMGAFTVGLAYGLIKLVRGVA